MYAHVYILFARACISIYTRYVYISTNSHPFLLFVLYNTYDIQSWTIHDCQSIFDKSNQEYFVRYVHIRICDWFFFFFDQELKPIDSESVFVLWSVCHVPSKTGQIRKRILHWGPRDFFNFNDNFLGDLLREIDE